MFQSLNGNNPPQIFKKGISVIEILVVVAILLIAFVGILGLLTFSLQVSSLIKETTYANFLAQETMEATRNIRDSDWTKLTNGNHGLTNTSGYWDFEGTENVINGFTRTILIENVFRDGNDNIVQTGGNLDPNTKKVKVTISWKDKKVEIVTYLTNWHQ